MLVSLFLTERSPYLGLIPQILDLARSPPPAIEHLSPLPYPFEFPRPFEVFDGCPFLAPLCSETPSNTFFGSGLRCSMRSMVLAVLAKPS